ncbi:hypothetical protein D3C72_1806560 [compost metagenome]
MIPPGIGGNTIEIRLLCAAEYGRDDGVRLIRLHNDTSRFAQQSRRGEQVSALPDLHNKYGSRLYARAYQRTRASTHRPNRMRQHGAAGEPSCGSYCRRGVSGNRRSRLREQ